METEVNLRYSLGTMKKKTRRGKPAVIDARACGKHILYEPGWRGK